MLDIVNSKTGKVVAVLMDDGTMLKKESNMDDIDQIVKDFLEKSKNERKKK